MSDGPAGGSPTSPSDDDVGRWQQEQDSLALGRLRDEQRVESDRRNQERERRRARRRQFQMPELEDLGAAVFFWWLICGALYFVVGVPLSGGTHISHRAEDVLIPLYVVNAVVCLYFACTRKGER
jgi:hypothetical protein